MGLTPLRLLSKTGELEPELEPEPDPEVEPEPEPEPESQPQLQPEQPHLQQAATLVSAAQLNKFPRQQQAQALPFPYEGMFCLCPTSGAPFSHRP